MSGNAVVQVHVNEQACSRFSQNRYPAQSQDLHALGRGNFRLAGCQPGILVVDDEPAIRNLLQIVLERYGFVVWQAGSGWEALKMYQQERPNIALVLLDVCMPGWDGAQTLAALQKLDPAVRCCFLTGHAGAYQEQELRRRGAEWVYAKPFRPAALVASLMQLLTRPSAG
jgi:CheY-like chemotaxis protein